MITCRHTDQFFKLAMATLNMRRARTDTQTDTQTDGRTDGRYQTHYLPATQSINICPSAFSISHRRWRVWNRSHLSMRLSDCYSTLSWLVEQVWRFSKFVFSVSENFQRPIRTRFWSGLFLNILSPAMFCNATAHSMMSFNHDAAITMIRLINTYKSNLISRKKPST